MSDCNKASVPADPKPLGKDVNGEPFDESWEYVCAGDENAKIVTKSDVFEDNNGALTVATLPKITPQSKFFAVKLHFFREHVRTESNPNGEIHVQKIETVNQLADIMTKSG